MVEQNNNLVIDESFCGDMYFCGNIWKLTLMLT